MACCAFSAERLFEKVFAELCASSLCIACMWLWRSFIRTNGPMSTKGELSRTRCHVLAFLCALCRLPLDHKELQESLPWAAWHDDFSKTQAAPCYCPEWEWELQTQFIKETLLQSHQVWRGPP